MKHFKKSAMMTALCLAGGLVYTANVQAEMVHFEPADLDYDAPEQALFDFNAPPGETPDNVSTGGGWATDDPNDAKTGVHNDVADLDPLPDNSLWSVTTNNSKVRRAEETCKFKWHGDQMAGMKVTFKYAGEGAGVEATWHPDIAVLGPDVPIPSPAHVGGATDGEWILYQPDDTFYRTWILRPLLGTGGDVHAITGVKIEGLADLDDDDIHSVFDIYYGPFMTPGTRHGRPFEPTALPEELVGDGQPLVTATYSEPVAIIPNDPEYDIYGTLDIHFEAPWDGMTYNPNGDDDPGEIRFLAYIADTDCVKDLSVNLISFDAQMTGEGVKLMWSTGTEKDNLKFEVYRGIPDGQGGYTNVSLVGSVDAEADAHNGASYGLVDPTGSAEFSYGLADIAADGTVTLHDEDIVTP